MKIYYLLMFVACFAYSEAARILAMIPTPSISHQVVFRPWFQELAKRGHEVVVITTDPAFPPGEAPANLTEIDLHDITYKTYYEKFFNTPRGEKSVYLDQMKSALQFFNVIVDTQLNTSAVKDVIYGGKSFDLLILEACARPVLALSHLFKAPVFLVSSMGPMFSGNQDVIGAPTHPLLYPSSLTQRLYNLTIWEKIIELYNFYSVKKLYYDEMENVENLMLQKHFGKDFPPLSQLYENVDMLFLNTHPIFEGNYPVPPSVVYMWGIHEKKQKTLPQDLETYLNNSKSGVIYVSFGTNTDPTKLPPEMIQIFMKVFCQMPHDVLFKWNNDELPGRCNNVQIRKWFPQPDLLRHPNVKLFVTQGGLQSTDEALTAGVPLVGIPMMSDQWQNVEKYAHFHFGIHLEAEDITEKSFKSAVSTVLEDESYRNNIKKLNALMRDEPTPALERVVWWTEHVLRHGGARHLRAPSANMSWARYYEIQLVAAVLSMGLIMVIVVTPGLYYMFKLIFGLVNRKSKND